jgi:hypothetical protein|tara:strand:- start:7009 stop:8949 length:1941 start_codon:yes stop_codon:yes gene_type:complete
MKKPPDKYKCIKLPITSILNKNEESSNIFNTVQDAVYRTNYITTKTSLLLRKWCLDKYHNAIDIPLIDENTIKMCMKSLLLPSRGPKPKNNNLILLNEFKKLHNFTLEDGNNLSSILDYYAITILTSIENNIKMHFFDYVNRFINSYFKVFYKNEITNKEFKKQLFKDLYVVKNDIINGTLNASDKFHNWIKEYRYRIVPEEYEVNYYYDVKSTPQKYLKYMIFMNIELEKIDGKMYQFFPIQSSIIPNHIQIDTKSIIELLVDKEKKQYLDNIELNKEFLWDKFFNITQKIKDYKFDNTIITDGYATSLRFIHKDYIEGEKLKKEKMKKGRKEAREMTEEDKEKKKLAKKKLQDDKKEINKFKKKEKPKIEKTYEFPYIDDVDKEDLKGNHIFIDPGKRTLFTMMNDDGKFYSYTNKQRVNETKRLKYQKILKKYREELNITSKENELSSFNSKSCNINKFNDFINKKISTNEILYKLYQKNKFRQYRWYAFINKKRTEDNMLNKIEKTYTKDSVIIIGDWSIGKQMKNFISTPNLSLKRKLQERFRVYDIDEYRTSCLNWKTEELCKNLYLPDKKNKERKMYSILTYKMENKRNGCINRDKNGCKNIQKIFNYYIEYNERPEKYKRGVDLQKLQTVLTELSNCS